MTETRITSSPGGPWAQPSGGAALTELLAEYERVVTEAGAPVRDWLAPGVSAEEVTEKLLSVHLRPNDEIVAWFGWQNGIMRAADGPTGWTILPGIVPGSLDELVAGYKLLVFDNVPTTEAYGNVMDPRFTSNGIGFGWLPLEGDNMPHFAVYCLGEPHAIPLVRAASGEYFDFEFGQLQAVSLCTPVTWWLEGIASGAHVWDPESQGWADPDYWKIPETQRAAVMV